MIQLITQSQIQVFPCIREELHKLNYLQKTLSYLNLYRTIRTYVPDLIHLNQAGLSVSVSHMASRLKIPLVVHVRLDQEASLAAKAYHIYPRTHFIAISQFVAQKLCSAGIPDSAIATITNPIAPLNEALPITDLPQIPAGAPIIGFVGRLTPDKGINSLIQAATKVCRKSPNTQFWLIGDDSGNLTAEGIPYLHHWKKQLETAQLTENVHFLGFRTDAPQIIQTCTLMALPSIAEPWGRVIAEAMNAQVPVIVSDSGASREMIQHEKSGLLCPPEDSRMLTQAIEKLLAQPELGRQLAKEAKHWVDNHCSPNSHADTVTALYNQILSNDHAAKA